MRIIDTHRHVVGDIIQEYALLDKECPAGRRVIVVREDTKDSLWGLEELTLKVQRIELPGDVAWRVWDALTGKKS